MDAILDVLGKLFSWIGAVLGPINEKVNDALREKTDFDFAQSTLIPAVLLVIAGGAFGYLVVAPRAGLEALVTWALHTDSSAPLLWALCLVAAVFVLCVMLIEFGHWLLLWLWMHVPLNRMRKFELPIVDYERMASAIEDARRDLNILRNQQNFFDRLLAAIVRRGRSSVGNEKSFDLAAEIAQCRLDATLVGEAAGRIHAVQEAVPAATPQQAKEDGESGAAASAGRIFADMIDSLRPGYLSEIRELSSAVRKFQKRVVATAKIIRERIAAARPDQLDELGRHLDELAQVSTDAAADLGAKLSADGWLGGEAWQGGNRLYMNSLAFNLAGTTLEGWKDRGPIEKWLRGLGVPAANLIAISTDDWKELLARLRKSRSSIATYTTVASILVLLTMVAIVAAFSSLDMFRNADDWWFAGLISAIVLVLAVAGISKAFIEPIVAHAFYISIVEARLRNRLGVGRAAEKIAWVRRPSRLLSFVCGSTALAALAAVPTWFHEELAGFTDHRLVVVAARDLEQGDGISTRNISHLVNVAWQRCTSPPAPWAEVSPARLVDTHVAQACKEGQAFAATDLTLRSSGMMPAGLAAAGVACKGEAGGRPTAPPAQMCRTTVNPPLKGERPKDKKVDLAKLEQALDRHDVQTRELLGRVIEAIGVLASINAKVELNPQIVAKLETLIAAVGGISAKVELNPEIVAKLQTLMIVVGGIDAKVEFNPQIVAKLEALVKVIVEKGGAEGPGKAPRHIGTVHFNFGCEDLDRDSACEKPTPRQVSMSPSCEKLEATRSAAELSKLAEALTGIGPDKTASNDVLVIGWADHAGAPELNRRLATSRALKIREKLEAKFIEMQLPGMKHRLHHFGIGEGNPDTDECDLRRRRADLYLIRSK